ncbi:hypothetical protein ATO12_23505 [Aquimarina atlantica]|uniref:Lipoprotein n=1 Tax=Aquimarina atlantica TaxID=1317122 RepID=A0A023BQT5_9FLAO|nr:DUF885 domain-containing protein [Aquimarina atlantica]EZH72422.1 hypothetical protein ATO12_23505 [Aquimarina atlantica]
MVNRYVRISMQVFVLVLFSCQNKIESQSTEWETITKEFIKDYKKLDLPGLELSFVENLKNIRDKKSVQNQEKVFISLEKALHKIDKNQLSDRDKLDYEVLLYECELNRERIIIEKKWLNAIRDSIPTTKIFDVPNGKDWYAYFLKKWVDKDATPDQIYALGVKEIEKVTSKIKEIQIKSGMDSLDFSRHIKDSIFFYSNVEMVQKRFLQIRETVADKLPEIFPFTDSVPEVKIKRGTNKNLSQVPGFYTNGTFYYNYFNSSFNKRQVGWLYIHEGMPGHHYQVMAETLLHRSDVQKMFRYRGVGEGWAAYVEEIGNEIGAYQNIYDELGKWEWDIIRSVRVALDVGLNYYGWSDQKALQFWQKYIKGQDDIAFREIARMKRWPVQVITYKYGSNKILQWKSQLEKNQNFNLREFHKNILKNGLLPYSILESQLGL